VRVLDASALLALSGDEPGADLVQRSLEGTVVGTANLAEVIGKLVDAGVDWRPVRPLLEAAGVRIEALTADDALLAGALRAVAGGRQLPLGDRCCLALALRETSTEVFTADRSWSELDLPLRVVMIR
jgi:ribonuclease VapC